MFEISAGKTMSAAARTGEDKTPFLRTSNVLWDEIDLTKVDKMVIPAHELGSKLLRPGDLLVCEGGEIGRAAIWSGEVEVMSFQNHLHRLRPLVNDVEPRFYAYFLQSAFTQLGIFEGAGNKTTIPNLSRNRLAALDVPHPPLDEQRAIAAALGRARAAIRSHDGSIAVVQDIKRAAMRELFTRGLRGEPQKETEIGQIPESWRTIRATSIFKLTSGATRPVHTAETASPNNPYPILGGNGIMGYSSCFNCDSPETLIIGRVGVYCGAIHLTSGKAWVTDNALYAKEWLDPDVTVRFMARYLAYFDLNRFRRVGAQPLVTQGLINEHSFPIPMIEEQKEMTGVLDSIDRKIDLHKRKKAVLEELFQGLLNGLMTGTIQVSNLDLTVVRDSVGQYTQPFDTAQGEKWSVQSNTGATPDSGTARATAEAV